MFVKQVFSVFVPLILVRPSSVLDDNFLFCSNPFDWSRSCFSTPLDACHIVRFRYCWRGVFGVLGTAWCVKYTIQGTV